MSYIAERRVLQTLLTHVEEVDLVAWKLPDNYEVQWGIKQGLAMNAGWAECQHRIGQRNADSAVPVDMKRWLEGCGLAKATSKPFLIVVEWDDGLFYVRSDEVTKPFFGLGKGADSSKEVPCIFIPTHLFVRPEDVTP
jgi:hypothetical protein